MSVVIDFFLNAPEIKSEGLAYFVIASITSRQQKRVSRGFTTSSSAHKPLEIASPRQDSEFSNAFSSIDFNQQAIVTHTNQPFRY